MRPQTKILLGLAGTGAALWATRAALRARRKISLDGRTIVVTGASSGLGLLVAREAARRGANLVIAARTEADLSAAAADLQGEGTGDVLPVVADVSSEADANRLIDRAIDRFGQVDVLVNNAGIMVVGPAETLTADDFREVLATNFWGQLYPTLAVLPHMRERRFGRIANVISIGGKVAVPHMLAYSTSKFAFTGLSEGLRGELARDNILVTSVYPGTIRTGGHAHAQIKGHHQAEYAWFGLSDTIPGLATSARACADRLWDAVTHGDPEVVVGLSAKILNGFHAIFPEWYAEVSSLINRTLPAAPAGAAGSVRGSEVGGSIATFVNRLVPPGTRPQPA